MKCSTQTSDVIAVTFMGSTVVLVTLQLITALAVANLVSRKDSPPAALTEPFESGILGKILVLNNTPLVGKVIRRHSLREQKVGIVFNCMHSFVPIRHH